MSKEYKNIGFIVAENAEAAEKLALETFPQIKDGNYKLIQDADCLDTWFSSWLWPISVFDGINEPDNKDIKYYYPTNDLVTAPEIIFFWVARMIMAGEEYQQKEPFKNVYFTGIVRDALGRKMSKSLGNSPDPIELIEKYGADSVRMGMLLSSPAGNDLPFDESLCEQGRNFCNKIWNAFRLVKGWEVDELHVGNGMPKKDIIVSNWFLALLIQTEKELDDLCSKYRLSEALTLLYKVFWDDYCSWYLEVIKPEFGQNIACYTSEDAITFFEELLKLLHPFMPFITEEIFHNLSEGNETIMLEKLTVYEEFHEEKITEFEIVKEIITNIRNIRQQKNISPKEALTLYITGEYNDSYDDVIKKLGNIAHIETTDEKPSNSVSFLVGTTEFSIPVAINAEEEIAKMEEEIEYLQGFLKSVNAKLNNEKFIANAKPEIIENERKKQADAESKISSLKANIEKLK